MSAVFEVGGKLPTAPGGFILGVSSGGGGSFYALPTARTTTWMPGVSYTPVSGIYAPASTPPTGWAGGLPTALYTQHGSTISPSGGDDAATINSALAAAGALASASNPLFVKLSLGSFLANSATINNKYSYVGLVGSGPGPGMIGPLSSFPSGSAATVITRQSGAATPVITLGQTLNSGATMLGTITSTNATTADAVAGANTISLATGLSGLSAGGLCFIDELFDPTLVWYNENAGQGSGFRGWGENGNASSDAASRPVGQALEILSYNSSTGILTVTTPLAKTYRLAFGAHIITAGNTPTKWAFVSNLFATPAGGGDGGAGIALGYGMYCWVQGCEVAGHTNEFGGGTFHFWPSFRCELRDSFVHSVSADINSVAPGGGYYNIVVDCFTSDCLIENNISWVGNKVMVMRSAGSGNVVGYNMMDDGYGSGYLSQMETGLNQDHMAGTHHTLFEGNYCWQMGTDSRWGNQTFATIFRNWLTGMRTSAWPALLVGPQSTALANPLIGLTISGFYYEDGYNRNPIKVGSHHLFYNAVGNILGYPGSPLLTSPKSTTSPLVQTGTTYETYGPNSSASPNQAVIPMWSLGVLDGQDVSSPTAEITGFISGTTLTAVALANGSAALLWPGQVLSGGGATTCTIQSYGSSGITYGGSGDGQTGSTTYIVNVSQTVGSSGSPVTFTISYGSGGIGNGLDPTVLPTTLRDGNYDYDTAAVHWHGIGGSGVGQVTPPGASTTGSAVLPSSLYMTTKPAWFGAYTWPAYDGSNATTPQPGILPAWARFQAGTPNTILSSSSQTTPYIRQYAQYANTAHAGVNSNLWVATLANKVLAGSTIYVIGMWPNFASTYPTMGVTDTAGNTYTQLDRINDLANKNLGIQGTQSMGHWYCANVPAGTPTINMSPTPITNEDWVAFLVLEIAGVHAAPLAGHTISINSNISPGTNNITVTATNSQPNALAIALAFDEVDDTTPTAPTAGTGFIGLPALWPFNTSASGLNCACCEYSTNTASGSITAQFSANEPIQGGTGNAGIPNYITSLAFFY